MYKIVCISILYLLSVAKTVYSQQNVADKLKPPLVELPSASFESAGLQVDSLTHLLQLIRTTKYPDFRGLIILKNNHLVMEEYFNTFWRESILDIRSAGKAIIALLLGIAIDQGLVINEEQYLTDFFPDLKNSMEDTFHQEIRIKDLLTMSSGLNANDNDLNSPGSFGNWILQQNWVEYALSLPMLFTPGERYVYNDVCPMLIGAIIEKTAGMNLAAFAKENLFDPLGIREYYWYTAPNGHTVPMGNLYLSTLDFAKIGQLVLNEGKWNGNTIVSSQWIQKMTVKSLTIRQLDPFADYYGYFWFIREVQIGNKNYTCIYASGNGGNLLFVVPEANMVVALTSSAYGQGYGHTRSHYILDALLKSLE